MVDFTEFEPDINLLYQNLKKNNSLVVDFAEVNTISQFSHPKMTEPRLQDKIKGAIFGAAVGDALGRILEDIEPDTNMMWVTKYQTMQGDKPGPIGKITDDVQFMNWVSDSLLEHNGLYPHHLADEFTSRYVRSISVSAQRFTDNFLKEELPWYECGIPTAGNGVVIRSVPVGIFYRHHASELKIAAGIMSMLTHRDPMAMASGIITSYTIARLLYLNPSDLHETEQKIKFLLELADIIKGIEGTYKDNQSGLETNLYRRLSEDLPEMIQSGVEIKDLGKKYGTDAYVLESLPFILYTFLTTSDDHTENAIINAVNLSKDSDTIGALTGAFAGALHGFSDIDDYYIENLEFRDKLEQISQKLYESPWKNS